jgi:hypothetical protein
MEQYIVHRLEVAGNSAAVTFTSLALDILFAGSKGVPRLINIICDFLLIFAFAEGIHSLDDVMVGDVIAELDFEGHFWGDEQVVHQPAAKLPEIVKSDDSVSAQVEQLLQKITLRLDSMEKEAKILSDSINKELSQKLTELQNAFMFHVKETDASLTALSSKIEKVKYQKMA